MLGGVLAAGLFAGGASSCGPIAQEPPPELSSTARARLAYWRIRLRELLGARPPELLRWFPELRERLPWLPLATAPTPVQRLKGIEDHLRTNGLWIKRDDLSSSLYGGNKVRKLEFILASALAQDADHVITMGGIGSHHCCATAGFAAQLGMRCTLVQVPQPVTEHVVEMLRWDRYFHAECVLAGWTGAQLWRIYALLRELRAQGERPYFVWAGGSTPEGTLGALSAGLELAAQVRRGELPEPHSIFVATGSCGTHAGLVLAMHLAGMRTRVVGVQVVPVVAHRWLVAWLARRTLELLRRHEPSLTCRDLPDTRFEVRSGYLGAGYGYPTPEGTRARELMAAREGIPLEDTYTAKTFAAFLDHARAHPDERPLLFWNTYNSRPAPELPPVEDLPPDYRKLLAASSA